jgi:hypothetical protein
MPQSNTCLTLSGGINTVPPDIYTTNLSTQLTYNINFPYLGEADVVVYREQPAGTFTLLTNSGVAGATPPNYTIAGSNPSQVTFQTGEAPGGVALIIGRRTNICSMLVEYQVGASIRAGDLNLDNTQLLYLIQELRSTLGELINGDDSSPIIPGQDTFRISGGTGITVTEVAGPPKSQSINVDQVTIWGQNHNHSGNVSGDLSFVNNITFNTGSGRTIQTGSSDDDLTIAGATASTSGALIVNRDLELANAATTKLAGRTYTWPSGETANNVLTTDGSGNLTWGDGGSASGNLWELSGTDTRLKSATDDVLFRTGNLIKVQGTDSSATVRTINIQAPSGDANFTADWTLTLPDNNGDPGQILRTDGNGVTSWVDKDSSAIWTKDGTDVHLTTNSDDVGIGTTTPDAKLEVSDTQPEVWSRDTSAAGAAGNNGASFVIARPTGTGDPLQTNDRIGRLRWRGSATDADFIGAEITTEVTNGNTNRSNTTCDMIFGTMGSTETGALEKMRLTGAGNATFTGTVDTTRINLKGTSAENILAGYAGTTINSLLTADAIVYLGNISGGGNIVLDGTDGSAELGVNGSTNGRINLRPNGTDTSLEVASGSSNGNIWTLTNNGTIVANSSANATNSPNYKLDATDGSADFKGDVDIGDGTYNLAGNGGIYLAGLGTGAGTINCYKDNIYSSGSPNDSNTFLRCWSAPDDATAKTTKIQFTTDGTATFTNKITLTGTGSVDGIQFGSTDSGGSISSQTLDDYEEGTWTPTQDAGNPAISNIGSMSGNYTKIGNQVTVLMIISQTSNNMGFTAGNYRFDGLPFTPTTSFCTNSTVADNTNTLTNILGQVLGNDQVFLTFPAITGQRFFTLTATYFTSD